VLVGAPHKFLRAPDAPAQFSEWLSGCVRPCRCAIKSVILYMGRLPATGARIASPCRDEAELHRVFSDLHVGHAFDSIAVHELYWKFGAVIGQWLSEQQRLEVSPIAKILLSTAKNLGEVSLLLGGLETGFHSEVEIAVAARTAKYLALDPAVGSYEKAQELISLFRQDANRIAHVCMVAVADLPEQSAQRGRRALYWYDDFTALLLDIADKAGIRPALRKDRGTGARSGWLFEAALALETFLYAQMRSPSAEACGSRLDRSKRRLQRGARDRLLSAK
jgi:hypothetical protein